MPCLLGCLALSTPRFVLIVVFLFSNYLGRAYATNLVPVLGFFFAPITTLAYAAAKNENGGVSGLWVAVMVLAVLMDLGVVGFGRFRFRGRRGPPPPEPPPSGRSITVHGERVS